jgi:hypothetical protein
MKSNINANDKPDIPKIIGIVGSSTPKLFFRFAPLLFKFKKQAKKGREIFYKELLFQGFDSKTAERLTEIYLEESDLFGILRVFQ